MEKIDTVSGVNLAEPMREFSTVPFWVWNDWITLADIERSLADLMAQNISQVIVHPRPGLMIPYLSDEWFALWRHALDVARRHNLRLWIYDENSYPSGFAGGHVPETMPESRALGIKLVALPQVDASDPSVLAVYRKMADGYALVDKSGVPAVAPEGGYWVAILEKAPVSPWYGGRFHTDLIRPGVTEAFLDVTLEPYRRNFGGEFGRLIPGVFTDEPHLRPCGDIHWTPDLPEQFKARWGEGFLDALPYLKDPAETGRAFRHHYFQLLTELFVERWAKPYYRYCEQAGLELTGHYWEHGWPNAEMVPDNMAMAAWQQRPGIDILFNEYSEGPHAQFGNTRAVLELASVANQTGRRRTLCEAFGGSGAEMTFEDYKRIGDWVMVLGVNTVNEHLSSLSLRGARKRDYPPTFSYHSPWMECYGTLSTYFSRVCQALSAGEQHNPCLILEPTTTAWMYHFADPARLEKIGTGFQKLVTGLAQAQLEFDLGSEHIIQERGSAVKPAEGRSLFQVGARAYAVVVLPAQMENLNRKTHEVLSDYLEQGGVVLSLAADLPSCLDGRPSGECARLRGHKNWRVVSAEDLVERVAALCGPTTRVLLDPGGRGVVHHHRRELADGEILFIANSSKEGHASGQVITRAGGVREVCLETGAVRTRDVARQADGDCALVFTLPPCGSLLLYLDRERVPAQPPPPVFLATTALPISDISVRRMDDNNLMLDFVDVEVGGERRKSLYWTQAGAFIYQKNGQPRNPWDRAVQYRDESLRMSFAPDSGFQATYRFVIEGVVPARLMAVVERAGLCRVSCNGATIKPLSGRWWIDRAFEVLDLAGRVKVGENTLTVVARPMTAFYELEAAHIIGDFAVKPVEKGFVIVPAMPLGVGDWARQGMPFYGHRVAYSASFSLDTTAGKRVVLSLPRWKGIVAQVLVNGQKAGLVYHQPMQCDITAATVPGENTVTVVVFGSLRNPLGPHLGAQALTMTSPWSWDKGPADRQPPGVDYYSVACGLQAPFEVLIG